MIVPVTNVSRLTEHAISEALSLGQEVVAVSVVIDQGDEASQRAAQDARARVGPVGPRRAPAGPAHRVRIGRPAHRRVHRRGPRTSDQQIVVLIPVVVPEHIRYRILHNQIDRVLSLALRTRTDVVIARVPMPIQVPPT